MTETPMQRFAEFLAGRDLRLTEQRRLIAEVFFRAVGHPSAEEITREVKSANAGIGFATVYRTLKLLTEAGLAKGMSIGDGFARYETPSQRGHHDHLICRGCGRIVEFENDQIESLQEKVARQHGFTVTDHKMELYGLCGACRAGGG
jgi:Fur family ferric uptake transcriptional regulator